MSHSAASRATVVRSRKVVRKLSLGVQPLGKMRAATFRCTLTRGTCGISVYATDRAGNKQTRVGTNTLVVR